MNAKERRRAKREEVRKNPKKVGRPEKVGVERGRGPRHAENSKEGEEVPSTDTVPAMLTPREAVLNRNAAEMAGRGNIEALNKQGNELAEKGVDLAGGKSMKDSKQKLAEGGDVGGYPAKLKKPPGYLGPPDQALGLDQGNRSAGGVNAFGGYAQNVNQWGNPYGWARQSEGGGVPGVAGPPAMGSPGWIRTHPGYGGGGVDAGGPQPMPLPQPVDSGFYPPGQGPFKMPIGGQEGMTEVPFLGSPEKAYGPPVQLSAPEILSKLQQAAKEQGLSAGQIAGIAKAFSGLGGGGGAPYDQLGGAGASFNISGGGNPTMTGYEGGTSDARPGPAPTPSAEGRKATDEDLKRMWEILKMLTVPGAAGAAMGAAGGLAPHFSRGESPMEPFRGYQGGISDIGYPPFIMPRGVYHADKGGWQGAYDPLYTIPVY